MQFGKFYPEFRESPQTPYYGSPMEIDDEYINDDKNINDESLMDHERYHDENNENENITNRVSKFSPTIFIDRNAKQNKANRDNIDSEIDSSSETDSGSEIDSNDPNEMDILLTESEQDPSPVIIRQPLFDRTNLLPVSTIPSLIPQHQSNRDKSSGFQESPKKILRTPEKNKSVATTKHVKKTQKNLNRSIDEICSPIKREVKTLNPQDKELQKILREYRKAFPNTKLNENQIENCRVENLHEIISIMGREAASFKTSIIHIAVDYNEKIRNLEKKNKKLEALLKKQ